MVISDSKYRRSLREYVREIQRKVRLKEIANRPPNWKPPKPVLKPLNMKFKPLGWVFPTKEELKQLRSMQRINPLKPMTPQQEAIYNRIPYKRRLEQKTHALANRLRRIPNYEFPQFKARILAEDEKRIRRQKILRRLVGKKYSHAMAKYLNTIPEYHRGKYVFYRLKEIFPELSASTRQNKVEQRFLLALLRRQDFYKHFRARIRIVNQWKRVCRFRRQISRGGRWSRPPMPFPRFRPNRIKRAWRKVRFYYKYLPRGVLWSPTFLNYRLRNAIVRSLVTRPIRAYVATARGGWFRSLLPTRLDKRLFLSRLKMYRQYMKYLVFLTSRRGYRFKPDGFKFDMVERIRYYSRMSRIRLNFWGVDTYPNLRYNLKSRFENFYTPHYRRRWKRSRWFIKRKTRKVSTYNYKYYRLRKHLRRIGRLPIRKVLLPIVDVRRTTNNFFIHVHQNNKTLFFRTAGMAGKVGDKPVFIGPKRRTPYAAEVTGREVGQRLLNQGLEDVLLRYRSRYSYFVKAAVKGLRSAYVRKKNTKEGRLKAIKSAFYRQKLRIPEVRIWVTLSHNGLRSKKTRRM